MYRIDLWYENMVYYSLTYTPTDSSTYQYKGFNESCKLKYGSLKTTLMVLV